MSDRRVFWRMLLVVVVVVGVWCALGFRLASLHLGDNERYLERIEKARSARRPLVALRGRILDRDAHTLAVSLKMKHVAIDPIHMRLHGETDRAVALLSRVLNLDPAEVRAAAARDSQYVVLKRHVEPDLTDRIESQGFKGVVLEPATRRFYPHGPLLCHVLGFSTIYGDAFGGIEQLYDRDLRGRPGEQRGLKDGRQRLLFDTRTEIPPEPGNSVQLTIDIQLQHLVEEALEGAIRDHDAKGAWGVVQECKTGRILAMASLPRFDLNQYSTSAGVDTNQVISYTYEPGSTLKALTFAAVFEEKLATEQEMVHCEGGRWIYRGRPLNDFHGYGLLSAEDVLKKSSNIGTAKLALRLGEARLDRYLRAFGLGERTGIELTGEGGGIFAPHTRWDKLMITRIPMGHAVAVTALQMVNAYSTIANGGFRMRPYLVERVLDPAGAVLYQAEPEVVARPISTQTAERVRRMMVRVTADDGTAKRARVDKFEVAGKTGTAEKIVNGRYDKRRNIASFAGFLPAENPELCILVVIDEPGGYPRTGGYVAAPVFRVIAEQAVRYLHIPPEGLHSSTQFAGAGPARL